MQAAFQYRQGEGGGSEREKLLLVWDSFLQSQEIQVEYSMPSTDDITSSVRCKYIGLTMWPSVIHF